MKKARVLLTAIGVLAVFGGAMALKAHNNPNVLFYKPSVPNGACSITTFTALTTTTTIAGVATQLSIAPTTTSCSTHVTETL